MVDVDGCDGRYSPSCLMFINSGVLSDCIGATFTLSSFWSILDSSSAIRPTSCGTISNVYSLISLGFSLSKGRAFSRIHKAVDVGLFTSRTSWNDACQLSSVACAGMVPNIFLSGWLLFSFTRVLRESAGRPYRKGTVLRIAASSASEWYISFHFAKFCHPDIPARSAYALHLALPMSYWGDV